MDFFFFFFSSRRRHTRCYRDWSSDVCSSDLPHRVVVDVCRGRGRLRGYASILGDEDRNAEQVDALGILRIDADLAHVPRILVVRTRLSPARAVVVRPIDLGSFRLHRRVNGPRLRSAHVETNASDVALWQTLRELGP